MFEGTGNQESIAQCHDAPWQFCKRNVRGQHGLSCRIPLQQQPFVPVTEGRNQLQMLHQHHHDLGGLLLCLSFVFVKYE